MSVDDWHDDDIDPDPLVRAESAMAEPLDPWGLAPPGVDPDGPIDLQPHAIRADVELPDEPRETAPVSPWLGGKRNDLLDDEPYCETPAGI